MAKPTRLTRKAIAVLFIEDLGAIAVALHEVTLAENAENEA